MSDEIIDNNGGAASGARPTFLTVLCILTFIGSGLSTLLFILATIAFTAMADLLSKVPGMDGLLSGGIAFFAVFAILAGASLFGAIQMWKLKKMGFYLYVGANVLAFVLPLLWIKMPFNAMGLVWLGLFITLYGLNLKHLK